MLPGVSVGTHDDYKFFLAGDTGTAAPVVDAQTDQFDGVVMMAANEPITVSLFAEVDVRFDTILGFPRPDRHQLLLIRPSRSTTRPLRTTRL
jgi:hypothetical protein